MICDDDHFCLDCGYRFDISEYHTKKYCNKCLRNHKQKRENKRFHNRRLQNVFHSKKVILLQSPYFSGNNLIKPKSNTKNLMVRVKW